MANLKISQMQELSSIDAKSLLYVVQDGISSQITAGNLFGKLPDMLLSGSLQLDTLESVVANGGAISDSHVVTALTVDNSDREFQLTVGTPAEPLANFMLKVIYLKTQFGGRAVIREGLIPALDRVTLTNVGDAAIFLSTPAGWVYLAGTAVVTHA